MAAATVVVVTPARGPDPISNLMVFEVTITGVSTTYTTATGGLPFDLTTALQTVSGTAMQGGQAPNYQQTINPNDLICNIPFQMSTLGFLPLNFKLGTPTYTAIPWQSDNGPAATPGTLATCPCTIRLWGTGASNAAAFAEVADGANSDALTVLIAFNRNGANS